VLPPVDLVLSSSVYEHLDDVEGITEALATHTVAGGAQLHFIDLRDHFFKYPFEMLCYSEATWSNWLNPTSNHNRYRLLDYERVFKTYFQEVKVKVTGSDPAAFEKARRRIRPEFLSGDPAIDAVTLATVYVALPKSS